MTRVRRWSVALVGSLTLVSVGVLAAEPFLLAATAVPLGYVLYGAMARVPPDAALGVERAVATADPAPGEAVDVTLTVTNEGQSSLTDVRVVDGVPDELRVVDGSPRGCTSLRPGESATLRYSVLAKRGTYGFADPLVRLRPLAATAVATATLEADGDGAVTCANVVSEVPLADATLPRAGTLPTDSGGSGLEFHATREYQHGDPVARIDWRRFAKTNALTTVEYREEQAVRTVLVVDARPVTRVTPEAGYPTGAELGAYAAERLFDALTRTGVVASLVAVGLDDDDVAGGLDPDGFAWVTPDRDGTTAARVGQVFDAVQRAATATGPAESSPPASGVARPTSRAGAGEGPVDGAAAPDGGDARVGDDAQRLLTRLPPTAQVVCFSPLLDDWPVTLVRSLAARGYPTTVVSPDVTRGGGPAQRVVGLERDLRLRAVARAGGARIDWDLEQPIDIALRASLANLFGSRP